MGISFNACAMEFSTAGVEPRKPANSKLVRSVAHCCRQRATCPAMNAPIQLSVNSPGQSHPPYGLPITHRKENRLSAILYLLNRQRPD